MNNEEKQKIRIGEAAKLLGVSVETLRNWERVGKLVPERSHGRQRYYNLEQIKRHQLDLKTLGLAWASSGQAPAISDEYYCDRQDRFTSRLGKMGSTLLESLGREQEALVSLLTLIAGEIGDNSFAHNIGNWPDVSGIFYAYNINKRLIVLTDRGRGVTTTLRNARPDIANDEEALRIAFTEIVSGRAPEQRGNGLKVVRKVVEENDTISLIFQSGLARAEIPRVSGRLKIKMSDKNIRGVYAIIKF